MNRILADAHFSTTPASNNAEGWSGVELHRSRKGRSELVARLIFWDAMGQFFIETLGTDLPVEIVEELIAEARATIRIR